MLTDIKVAWRQLRKSPGFALTAIITLALGIGANAIVFSVLNAFILRPLNVPQAQNLYNIEQRGAAFNSYPDYLDLRDRNRSFEGVIAYAIMGPVGFDSGNNPTIVWPYEASGNYFDALKVQPYLGRFFHTSDEHGFDSAPYLVLSYGYWHSKFHGDPGIVGRVVTVDKHPFTVLGVAPENFHGTELFFHPDMWLPVVDDQMLEPGDNLQDRENHSLFLVGRLKAGITSAQATSDMNSIAAYLVRTYPKDEGIQFSLTRPGLLGNFLGGPARAFVAGLMLLAGLILLAACANLGSLFAARAADRAREIAVRMALGSRRNLILRQLLTEAVTVSLIGGSLGLLGALFFLRWFSAWRPFPGMPASVPSAPDFTVYVVAILLAIVSGLLFGMVPARQVMNADPYQVIRSGTASQTGRRFALRDLLLAAQVAICAVLITSSLVAVRGLVESLHSNFGFEPRNAMLVESHLNMAGYEGEKAIEFQHKILEAASAIPGVSAAGVADKVPLGLDWSDANVFAESTTDYRSANAAADAWEFSASPEYFRASSTTLLSGRTFTWHDDSHSPQVAVINREFARKVFGSVQKAVGSRFKVLYLGNVRVVEVVGVAEDGKYQTLTESPQAAMFFPLTQWPSPDTMLIVRSNRDPRELTAALETMLRGLDPALPFTIRTWNRDLDSVLFPSRMATVALGVLGILGAMLAVTGIFGMAAYVVSKRRRELGIRVALGAQQKQILNAALGRAFRLLAAGSVAGILLGLLATRVLAYIVYQATPRDPLVLAGVILTMLLLGLVAALIPARRALAVDPMILLREQ